MSIATTMKKTVSASCKAHAVLEWKIGNARSLQQRKDWLYSEHLPFSDAGFGASRLQWGLLLARDYDFKDNKEGDPKSMALFLGLVSKSTSGADGKKAQATYTLDVFLPKTSSWKAISGSTKAEFEAGSDQWAFGCRMGVPHGELFGKDSLYISEDGALIVRAAIDFEIASNPVSHIVSAVCDRLADFHLSDDVGDVELVSSDGFPVKVHRAIISAHSSVFRAMFQHDTKEKETGRAVVEDVNKETLNTLIKFLYSGDTSKVKDAAEKVLEAADKYNVSDLRDLAEKYLCEGGITQENAYRLSVSADRRNLPQLSQAVSGYIATNWFSLRHSSEFLQLKATSGHLYAVLEAACKAAGKKH